MHFVRALKCAVSALCLFLILPSPADAQFRGQLYVSGLTRPVAFVQDPSNASVQFVVELGGTIRVIQGGTLLSAPFLDLRGAVGSGGERGMLSLAFPPGAAESGRFFVTFVNTAGNTVVARFYRSANPLVADASTRFDLQWSTGERFIAHPETLHYGGNLVFGAEGYLYIGTGDGGEPDDASHQAQNLSKLHGKLLRINVNVGDGDPEGLDIPPDNPFAGGPVPEIWSIGLRNPWRFTLDDPRARRLRRAPHRRRWRERGGRDQLRTGRSRRAQLRLAKSGRRQPAQQHAAAGVRTPHRPDLRVRTYRRTLSYGRVRLPRVRHPVDGRTVRLWRLHPGTGLVDRPDARPEYRRGDRLRSSRPHGGDQCRRRSAAD